MESKGSESDRETIEKQERTNTLYLTYIRGLSEGVERAVNISRAVIDLKIRTVFKSTLTLRHCLTKVKTPTDPINTMGVVYRISCEYGRAYVGETGRKLKQRFMSINEWSRMMTAAMD